MSDALDAVLDSGEISPASTNGHVGGESSGIEKVFCPHCDRSWPKPPGPAGKLVNGWLTNHIRAKHPDEYEGKPAAPSNTVTKPKVTIVKKPAAQKPAAPRTPRKKADEVIEDLSALAGTALIHTGIDPGVGAVLMAGAPILGQDLDELAAGTVVDRVALQPLARLGGRSRELGSLVLLGVMVAAVERKPKLYPQAYPLLRMGAAQLAPGMIRSMKRSLAEQKNLAEQFAEVRALQEEMDALRAPDEDGTTADPVEGIIRSFFAHMTPQSEGEGGGETE